MAEMADNVNLKDLEQHVHNNKAHGKLRTIGLCLGASTISVVRVEQGPGKDGSKETKVVD